MNWVIQNAEGSQHTRLMCKLQSRFSFPGRIDKIKSAGPTNSPTKNNKRTLGPVNHASKGPTKLLNTSQTLGNNNQTTTSPAATAGGEKPTPTPTLYGGTALRREHRRIGGGLLRRGHRRPLRPSAPPPPRARPHRLRRGAPRPRLP